MSKWLIAGTGPSMHDPGEQYKVVTLNRAVCHFDRPIDCAVVFHSLTVDAIARDLHRARHIISPHPFDMQGDWLHEKRFMENVRNHPAFAHHLERWEIVQRSPSNPHSREFTKVSSCIPRGPSIVCALWWLVKKHDVRHVYTVGVDGGVETSGFLEDAYANREKHPAGSYKSTMAQFIHALHIWDVHWSVIHPGGVVTDVARIVQDDNNEFVVKTPVLGG